uniref:Uncharacterized protein n=1 Tax=Rhizophora mucronata TaxID=61149 RepID=A0A2P2P1A8_RHIMU
MAKYHAKIYAYLRAEIFHTFTGVVYCCVQIC